jgi:threonyl-tRNA synthetase
VSIARSISKSLLERTVISRVDGELWDLTRPLERSCRLELIDFDNIEGGKTLRSAYIFVSNLWIGADPQ